MHKLRFATILVCITSSLEAQVSVKEHDDAYALEASANIVINYSPGANNKSMEIYLRSLDGKISSKPDHAAVFVLDAQPLKKYFDALPHKDLIVVIFEKTELEDSALKAEALVLRDYFLSRGFNRISVQAHTGGSARPIYLDHKKQNKPEMATPRKPSD